MYYTDRGTLIAEAHQSDTPQPCLCAALKTLSARGLLFLHFGGNYCRSVYLDTDAVWLGSMEGNTKGENFISSLKDCLS